MTPHNEPRDVPLGSNNTDQIPDEKQKITLTNYVQSKNFREVVICIILCLFACFVPHLLPTNQRPIPYQITNAGDTILDLTYNNDLVGESVHPVLNAGIGVISLIMQMILSMYLGKTNDAHLTICTWFMTMGITGFLTECIKRYCGYLRPIYFSLCQFDGSTFSCKDDDHKGRISFLSGHASTSFCCMTILTLYLFHNKL